MRLPVSSVNARIVLLSTCPLQLVSVQWPAFQPCLFQCELLAAASEQGRNVGRGDSHSHPSLGVGVSLGQGLGGEAVSAQGSRAQLWLES